MAGDAPGAPTAFTRVRRDVRPQPHIPVAPSIRQVIAERRELAAGARSRALSPLSTLRYYLGTSPGRLIVILLVLAAACIGTGWYASTVLDERTSTLQRLIDRTEPLSEAAQVLYSSLSIADASANSAFISGGLESPELRTRYSDSLATAATALVTAAAGTPTNGATAPISSGENDPAVRADLDSLAVNLPAYAGLIEAARANNRLGNPVGSAYLGQASALMQETILPAAQRLYESRAAAISDPQRSLTAPPWGIYAMLALVLVAIGVSNRYLARRTRRRFNIGLMTAFIALACGTVWLLVAGLFSVAETNSAKTDGADPLRSLTNARILTQQARSAETLSLLRSGDLSALDQTFDQSSAEIATILHTLSSDPDADPELAARLSEANEALLRWQRADAEVRDRIRSGDFTTARALTVGQGQISTATGYRDLDESLVAGITLTRATFRDDIHNAQQLIGHTGNGILSLSLFSAAAVGLGLIPRIREYR